MNFGGNNKQHMKLFGIEDFWGNIWEWVDGLTIDENYNIIISYKYDKNRTIDMEIILSSGLTANSSGWVKNIAGTNDTGFMGVEFGNGASSSTYWADLGYLYALCVLLFGGGWSYGTNAGPFSLCASNAASDANRNVGARLTY